MKEIARHLVFVTTLGLVFLTPRPIQAATIDPNSGGAPVSGQFKFGGDATVAATFLAFLCDVAGVPSCPAGSGDFNVSGAAIQTGSFVPYGSDTGFIKNLSNTGGQPLNTPFLLSNFVTFNPAGTIQPPDIAFDLTFIFLGDNGQAECNAPVNQSQVPAQRCTPVIPTLVTAANPSGLSAFKLENTPTGSTASFAVSGNVRRLSTGASSPWNGTFAATFTNTPGTTDGSFQAVVAQLNSTGFVSAPYAATFAATATAVPEPMTSMLLGSGLLAFGFFLRRKRC